MRIWMPALALQLAALPALGQDAGAVRVIDGDTIEIAGQRIELHGIDAPEPGQACARQGVLWGCGQEATLALSQFVVGRTVRCRTMGGPNDGTRRGRCRVGTLDLGAEMVGRGLAVADLDSSRDYLPQQREARAVGAGMFGGSFVKPRDWRRGRRLDIEAAR